MATTMSSRATEADLLRMPDDGFKYELVDGAIRRMTPAGWRHGAICVRLSARLLDFVGPRKLGHLAASDTGIRLPGGNVRAPDISFIAAGRFDGDEPIGFSPIVPDLAVEVLSPDDRPRALLDKVGEYLESGVQLVWVIDPESRRATRYRSWIDVTALGPDDELDGEDVLPGFRCRLSEILE